MAASSEDYFDTLATHSYQPLLCHVTGIICFRIGQRYDKPQHWRVTINQGAVEVHGDVEDAGDADCVLAGPEDEFVNIFNGLHSFAAAYVRGAITVQGDHTLAQNLRRFSPPAQITEEPRANPRGGAVTQRKLHTAQRAGSHRA